MARRAPRQEEEGARKLFDETPQPVAFSGEGKLVIWLQSSQPPVRLSKKKKSTPCPEATEFQVSAMLRLSRYKMYVKFYKFLSSLLL